MSLSQLFLAVTLIMLGLTGLGIVMISGFWIGLFSLITGILLLVEGYRPITIFRRA